jgi:hypothetical protein
MERTARRVPEVMVRATGRQHGGGHVLANFSYISRLGHGEGKQVALYTSDEEVLHDARDMQILAQDWQEWEMGGDARRNGATSISMILSMPAGTDLSGCVMLLWISRAKNLPIVRVAALHVDRDHPHVHLTIARRDHDGRRFHPNRDDFFRYRQRLPCSWQRRMPRQHGRGGSTPSMSRSRRGRFARRARFPASIRAAPSAQRLRESGVGDPVDAVLASQQAIVRRAYERSIEEMSAAGNWRQLIRERDLEKRSYACRGPRFARHPKRGCSGNGSLPADRWLRRTVRCRRLRSDGAAC